jgi:hypothetical protein
MSNSQVLEHVKNGNTLQIPAGVKPQLWVFFCLEMFQKAETAVDKRRNILKYRECVQHEYYRRSWEKQVFHRLEFC